MKSQTLLIVFILITPLFSKAQTIDRAPNGTENYRAVEGGSEKVNIDTKTPLNVLINKLEKSWDFVETGKMYWIGYTDYMYSIAAHNDEAIKPLLMFIDSTKNLHAKLGAVYTLHLIGIHRTIAGRFTENFKDKQARNALLYLLKYNDIGETTMSLLIRDPWQSDIPRLFYSIKNNKNAWYIVSALTQYNLKDYPLDGKIPDNIARISYSLTTKQATGSDHFEDQLHDALRSLKSSNNPLINIDGRLFNYKKLWGDYEQGLDGIVDGDAKNDVYKLLSTVVSREFIGFGVFCSKINYYMENGILYICSPEKSRILALKWWGNQPAGYKKQFIHDATLN